MGIHGLTDFLLYYNNKNKNSKHDIFKTVNTSYLKGKKLLIDANGLFSSITSEIVKNEMTPHLNLETGIYDQKILKAKIRVSAYYNFVLWMNRGVTPIYVFDGPPPEAKRRTREKRYASRDSYVKKRDEMIRQISAGEIIMNREIEEELMKHCRYSVGFHRDYVPGLVSFLRKLGCPCLVSTTEAERLCCMMAREFNYPVLSDDTDCIVHGAPIVVKDHNHRTLECVVYKNVLNLCNLTPEKFIELCVLLGCDYNEKTMVSHKAEAIISYGGVKEYIAKKNSNIDIGETGFNLDESMDLFKPVPWKSILDREKSCKNLSVVSQPEDIIIPLLKKHGIRKSDIRYYDAVRKLENSY